MPGRIHVSNLNPLVNANDLQWLFSGHGMVYSARMRRGKSGVGSVQMASDGEGEAAIAALNGSLHLGQTLIVGWAGPVNL